jgi:hypothetical protein
VSGCTIARARAVDEWREENERNSRGVVRAPRPDVSLDVAGELLPEKQILGRQLRAGRDIRRKRRTRSAMRASAGRSTSGDNTVARYDRMFGS